jgi:predicted aspartyl protease
MPVAKCGFNDHPGGPPGKAFLVSLGPTILVDIGFDPDYKHPNIPVPGLCHVHALVDTGATESCIDNLLAAQLNLPVVDRRLISGVGGSHEVNMYMAQVHVPALQITIHGAFAGVDLKAGGQMHGALIGRTFLANFRLVYDGRTGDVSIEN